MRSAWLKYARAVEHAKVLAAESRKRDHGRAYDYRRFDNLQHHEDPLVRMHWQLRIRDPYPERWALLIGDCLVNFRAALDHAMWAAVHHHSGPPRRPRDIEFPIAATEGGWQASSKKLRSLPAPQVWDYVQEVQPFHGGAVAHTAPIEILRYLNNRDKHRMLQLVGFDFVNLTPIQVEGEAPIEIVDQWQKEGPTKDGDVVARLKLLRPAGDGVVIDITPTMAHRTSLQISDDPVEYHDLASLMDVISEHVLRILTVFTALLDDTFPTDLYFGEEHDLVVPDGGGNQVWVTGPDGSRVKWTEFDRPIESE